MAFDFDRWLRGPRRKQTGFDHDPRYDALPQAIRHVYTPEQFAWLSDREKDELEERSCMPDPDDFGF